MNRIEKLETAQAAYPPLSSPTVKVSGYLNAVGQATSFDDEGPTYYGADSGFSLSDFSTAGIQFDARLNERTGATIQLLSDGAEGFDTDMEWGFIAFNPVAELKLRAGRMVAPFFMHSQYYHAGYAYHWVELPSETYNIAPVRSFEGIDATWLFDFAHAGHALNLYYGNTSILLPLFGQPKPYVLENMWGINLTSYAGNLTTWLAFNTSLSTRTLPDASSSPDGNDYSGLSLDNTRGYFAGAGIQYQNDRLLVMAEFTELDLDQDWAAKGRTGYLSLGYRLGKFTPHVTWAQSTDLSFDEVDPADPLETLTYQLQAERHQKSWTLGVRFDVAESLALKCELSRYYDIGNQDNADKSPFLAQPGPGLWRVAGPAGPTQYLTDLHDKEDPMVFRVAASLVF